jgi:AcrR family transcriptional regulator
MRAMRKKDYHHGDLRRALIEAAVKAIAKHGLDALNLRALAGRAGVSSGAPYHHFASREELLRAIADEGFVRFEKKLIAERDAAGMNPQARLEALGRAYLSFAIASPGYFRVMFHGAGNPTNPTQSGLRAFHLLREAVAECRPEAAASDDDLAPLVLTAWSAVHGLATLWVDGALPFEGLDPESLAPRIAQGVARLIAGQTGA